MPFATLRSWRRSARIRFATWSSGRTRAGKLLELVVMDRPQGPAVIHAMELRPKYRRLLPGE